MKAKPAWCAIALTCALVTFGGRNLIAQPSSPLPQFEVASIKSVRSAAGASFTEIPPGGQRFSAVNTPLQLLIMTAYGLTDRQISGGPSWVASDRYDIEAKAEHPAGRDQILLMLQSLLEDRFGLRFHIEMKAVPVYVLTGKGRVSGLRRSESAAHFGIRGGDGGQVLFRKVSTAQLAHYLSLRLRTDVIDETGLSGEYDFELTFRPESPPVVGTASTDSLETRDLPALPDAVRDQLGLRLRSQKGVSTILVIDSVAKALSN